MLTIVLNLAGIICLQKFVNSASFSQSDDWSQYPTIPNFYKPHLQCLPIPPNMTLCQNIGYNKMVLPNFLDHTSAVEAIHQSNIWNSLAQTKCHPGLQQFLCSLYAPVCLKGIQQKKIPPCFQLCNQVRKACEPRMHQYGYKWPDIVKCEQFRDDHLCIRLSQPNEPVSASSPRPNSNECAQCKQSASYEDIINLYCIAKFAGRAQIQTATPSNGGLEIFSNKMRMFKENGRISSYFLPCGQCNHLQSGFEKKKFLIMGSIGNDGKAIIDFLLPVEKSNRELKTAMRSLRKSGVSDLCGRVNEIQAGSQPTTPNKIENAMLTTPTWANNFRIGSLPKKQKKSVANDRERREITRCKKFLQKIADRRKRRRQKKKGNKRNTNTRKRVNRRNKRNKRKRSKAERKQRRQKRKEKIKRCKNLLKDNNILLQVNII